jgi:alpha-2-macroglobulin-like protein
MIKLDENLLDYVDDYVHGLLSAEDAEVVRQFCKTSRLGQVALDEARQRYAAMQSVPPVEASEDLVQKTIRSIEADDNERQQRWWYYRHVVFWATAAAVLIIGSVNTYYYHLRAAPFDVRLLGQSQLLAGSQAALRVAVWNVRDDRPMAGIHVSVSLYNPANDRELPLANLVTDANGTATPRFELPDWDDGRYELRVVAQPHRTPETLTRTVHLRRDWRLMVSTDKPVYQPGQTIHIRALALQRPDLRPLAGNAVVFTVTDPKGNVIFKQTDTTSRFGITSADCPLAREVIHGDYRIQCIVGSTTSEATVRVEKYVLPKFKVELTLDKSFYSPGDLVHGTVQADYFFGKPVSDGIVEIEVRAMEVGATTLATIDARTGAEGNAPFSFQLPSQMIGREQENGQARFLLAATVTDRAGQQHSIGTSRIVSSEPIQVTVIPEGGTLVQGVPNTVYLITSYADGRPAETRIVAEGVSTELPTSSLGVAELEVTPTSQRFGLTVKATDAEGRIGRRTIQLSCGRASSDFLVRPDKAVYTGGETLQLTALGGGVQPVWVDLLKDGQTMLSSQIEMRDGQGRLELDLPPELFGTLELVAYRFGAAGLPVRKTRTLLVQQARQIEIRATMDQDEYRPGARATIQLSLTDPDGRPVPGALSLQAVDQAVYSVLGQRSNLEQAFFLLEQELLQPVYTIYPGWSPTLFSELPIDDRMQWQQALFSATAAGFEGAAALPAAFVSASTATSPGRARHRDLAAPMLIVEGSEATNGAPRSMPFTLAANSFSEKAQEVGTRRADGLNAVAIAWWWLAAGMVVAATVGLAMFRPNAFWMIVAIVVATIGCLLSLALLGVLLLFILVTAGCSSGAGYLASRPAPDAAAEHGSEVASVPATTAELAMPIDPASSSETAAASRVREWFPETLLWRPELITDDNGQATLELDLADSITTWRLTTSAVSAEGQLGGAEFPVRVFQPFFVDLNLPVSLTRNDRVGVPVVVYNYLDDPQTVTLTLTEADWFEPLGDSEITTIAEGQRDESTEPADPPTSSDQRPSLTRTLELKPGEIRSLHFPLRVLQVGRHSLEITAMAAGVSDAIRREIEVIPDGRRVEEVTSGMLGEMPIDVRLDVPAEAIEGSTQAIVKLYPSSFSQVVEGLEAIFQMPYGCFEQTSSTTYPNVLALQYLRATETNAPEVEAKARQYIHLGCQRLLSFEIAGGGFDWFGRPPANRTLTAYGLMQFSDMAKVHDVDPQVIQRTRDWLLAQQRPDGSWPSEAGMLNDGLASSVYRGGTPDLAATAYIAWAVFQDQPKNAQAAATLDYLLSHPPESIPGPYLLALTINAIAAIDPSESRLDAYAAHLDSIKQVGDNGKLTWWEQAAGQRTTFYGAGRAGDIEATALAAMALLKTHQAPATARAALTWLVEQKDARGTWHSTQATVLALRVLLAGATAPLGDDQPRRIDIVLGGESVRELMIPADQAEVLQMVDLSDLLVPGNRYDLQLVDHSRAAVGYQVALQYHVPELPSEGMPPKQPRFSVDVVYDRQHLEVDQTVSAVASVKNLTEQPAPMVILDLPIPGGFTIDGTALQELVDAQLIARYEITPRQAILYLRRLDAGQSLELRYPLRATMPVTVTVPDAEVYEYYDPANRARGGSTKLEATESQRDGRQ